MMGIAPGGQLKNSCFALLLAVKNFPKHLQGRGTIHLCPLPEVLTYERTTRDYEKTSAGLVHTLNSSQIQQ